MAINAVDVLKKVKKVGTVTAAQVGATRAQLSSLVDEGLLVEAGVHKTGKRGRPSAQFKLSKKGSDKVRRAK